MASNEVEAIRRAYADGDAVAEKKAYDKYAQEMTEKGQSGSIKTLKELRG